MMGVTKKKNLMRLIMISANEKYDTGVLKVYVGVHET